ncbi:hypothetical protein SAMN04488527_10769 [Aliiroseovarius crassostreae]|nr:hypothetical protein [Aliiroseovarius crassostreae]SFU59086.1 hypothetical protein SAMN04488527_10769 [Aliiroseovarius crassostreae]
MSLCARLTDLKTALPDMQIFWQVWAVAPVLLRAALFVETLYRGITSGLFLFWFWLLKHDKVSSVAFFAFLSPIFGVAMGGVAGRSRWHCRVRGACPRGDEDHPDQPVLSATRAQTGR